jgi:Zn-dependent protease
MTTLSFRLGPVPVRIHVSFLLIGLLLGLGAQRGVLGGLLFATSFLLSFLAHEVAHAFAAHRVGGPAEVRLTLFGGGLATRTRSLTWGRRAFVSLAGPAMSIVIGAGAFGIARVHPTAVSGIAVAPFIGGLNLGWGLLNLLPILPLDGGHALVAVLDRATRGRGESRVRWVSIVAAVGLGALSVHFRAVFPTFICVLVALQNTQSLWAGELRNGEAFLRARLQAAFDALERGNAVVAIEHGRAVLDGSEDPTVRTDAVRLLAYAYATNDGWESLTDLLTSRGQCLGDAELEKYEQGARTLGRRAVAVRIALLRARLHGAASETATGRL